MEELNNRLFSRFCLDNLLLCVKSACDGATVPTSNCSTAEWGFVPNGRCVFDGFVSRAFEYIKPI